MNVNFVFLFVGNGILIGREFFYPGENFMVSYICIVVCFWWMKSKGKKNILYSRMLHSLWFFSHLYCGALEPEPSLFFYFCCSFVPDYTPSTTWKCCLLVMFKLAVAICCGPFWRESFSTSDLLGRTYGNLEQISWRFWMIFFFNCFSAIQ